MNRLEHTTVPVVAISHPGVKRKENEDRYGVSAFTFGPQGPNPVLLAVLSDGIGGHRAGEVAAELAVDVISHTVAKSNAQYPTGILIDAVQSASDAIRDQALMNPDQAGMGATCACAWVIGNRLYTATVGDSRIYLIRSGMIHRLSTDHTWIQEAIERGILEPGEVNNHPNAHVIRRYLGSPVPPEVDVRMRIAEGESNAQAQANQGYPLLPGDRVLLTSDGLTDLISDAEILAAYQKMPAEAASQSLVDLAIQRGGHDNITLVTFQMPEEIQAARPAARRASSPWRWFGAGCMGVVGLALVVGLGIGAWLWSRDRLVLPNPFNTPTPTMTITLPAVQAPTATVEAQAATTSPSQTRFAPSSTPSQTPSPSFSLEDSGATLTPWPTNTLRPNP